MSRQKADRSYFDGARGILRRHPRLYQIVFKLAAPVLVTGPDVKEVLGPIADRGGLVVDLGSGNDRRHPRFRNVDRLPFSEVDLLADLEKLPFRDEQADGVVSIVVLEHVGEMVRALEEIRRILAVGGRLYLAVPFLQPFHAAPHDYRRWTVAGLESDLEGLGFQIERTGVYCGPTSAVAWLLAEYSALLLSFGSPRLRALLSLPFQVLFSPLKWLDLLVARIPGAENLASAIYVVATRGPAA